MRAPRWRPGQGGGDRTGLDVIGSLFESAPREVPLDGERARRAAAIRAAHHDRERYPISLADAVLLASAAAGDRIATADPDFLAVAVAEGIERLALPSGSRPRAVPPAAGGRRSRRAAEVHTLRERPVIDPFTPS